MSKFKKIGLIGKHRSAAISDTLQTLIAYLQSRKLKIYIEADTATILPDHNLPTLQRDELGKHCDLLVVVGGDGSLLHAARTAVDQKLPVLGINRGRLGFLTDIRPDELDKKIDEVLAGHFREEQRFLLNGYIKSDKKGTSPTYDALNDMVLFPGDVAHMIEFEIYIDNQFVCSQRADGMIVATPTGSTAYALSGGGPILHPQLDAIVLVPMFPHTLSSRPIVIDGNSEIRITISSNNETAPRLSCDGQERIPVEPGASLYIKKKPTLLRLIHPLDYNYFETLRDKLHWEKSYNN